MAEAFAKTFKRDYVRVWLIPDAASALALLDGWMDDYNPAHSTPDWAIAQRGSTFFPTSRVSGLTGSTPSLRRANRAAASARDSG